MSNLGRVRSLERDIFNSRGIVYHLKEKILVQGSNKDGYSLVSLSKNGKMKTNML